MAKIYLAKHSIPDSRYPTVTSSFFVDSVFDLARRPPLCWCMRSRREQSRVWTCCPDCPLSTCPSGPTIPRFALFTITVVIVGLLVLYAVLSIRAVEFWRRVRQGVVNLTDFRRYLSQVASWMATAWMLRFAAFWFFLEAFNIGGSVQNVLFMMGVQAVSTLTPFTPGGAGAQQALMVYAFRDIAPRSTVLAYSVGQQVAIAAFNVATAMVVLFLMLRTFDIRGVVRRGEEERRAAEADAAERTGPARPGSC